MCIRDRITSAKIQEMCGFTKQQARSVIDKMRSEKLINLNGKGPAARYVISVSYTHLDVYKRQAKCFEGY